MLKARVHNKWDALISFTGAEGVGKTTAMYWIGKESMDKSFRPKRNIIYEIGYKEVVDHLKMLDQYEFVGFDEAIRQFSSKRHMTRASVSFEQLFTVIREGNYNIYGLCIPRHKQLLKFFRDGRSFLWVHVIRRGLAVIYSAELDNPYGDPWNIRLNEKRFRKTIGGTTIGKDIRAKLLAYKTSTNFLCFMKFPPMPQGVEEAMREWKLENRLKGINEQNETSGFYKAMQKVHGYRRLLFKLGMPTFDVCKFEGIDASTISRSAEQVNEKLNFNADMLCKLYNIVPINEEKK